MAEQSVYSAPEAQLEMPGEMGTFSGFNRLQYFLFSLAIGVANFALGALFADAPVMIAVSMIAAIVASIYIVVMRLKNVGASPWWVLAFIVPLLNIYAGLMCVAFPEGYSQHKQLDGPAKIIIGLFLGVFVLGIAAAVAVPMLAAN
jgi:uncharacterized membrane protein YhaH (DUF805 family)